ncbi:50S ribosomal protein L25/general stress protein Ctc [Tenacibaculum finnmarkense]|uniref:Large ribosomal subunit protein bL25 n=1 Tax=Tenacibaculum finnmarkense genomovar finnmarkense TaxID=1458503 RepID=A0AAP1WF19_9FLAO|nr:50S ribosomal protein L25/general stress protein Ctc [Tenacibaculum finnmarkense]MBE7651819.1 50S ribosomal protein L25/general stress protein Ctc [Tenacibaculum finnmarkense genomovar finnmarkense]MBE7659378.1 50S ribosomal protein L25/general stress protein Ctc [Tenacibaculum finnmarkense genomovar finnmarkense]MBE7693831.1 50S ribosomal protein L25/general stress protein Ctc [Tenacibaculum finnmarkense genomovar finnmarkense]MCD8428138.1 50S ribosomal protein L25/general stress protein Ct
MKSITINGSKRESVGKRATKDLRNAGKVPCVLYGGDELVHFSATEKLFKPLVFTPDVFTATIELDGAKYSAILQDIQFHPVTEAILHVDFYQIFDDKELTMDIPVKLVGTAKGIMLGGALRHNLRKLKVKALPANLPDFIEADITELAIGSKLYVTELRNDKYALLHPDNTVVAQVRMSRNAAKAAAEGEEEEA